uniref:Uncharacterized protein n=1 Tax=viral metagenome TaxID=1070528 RepID=A0A6C0HJH8_9ZZZZ
MHRRDFSISSIINQPYNKFPHFTSGSGVGGLSQSTRRHKTIKAGTCKNNYYLGKETGGTYPLPCLRPPTNLAITGYSIIGTYIAYETITWNPVVGAISYNIYVNGVFIGNTTSNTYTMPISTNTISVSAADSVSDSVPASLTRIASVINYDGVSSNTHMFNTNPVSIGCNWIPGGNQIQMNSIAGKTYYFKLSFDDQSGFSNANITLLINGISQGVQFSQITNGTIYDPDIDTFFIFTWVSTITGNIIVDFNTVQNALGHDSYCIILSN